MMKGRKTSKQTNKQTKRQPEQSKKASGQDPDTAAILES
jgi:hypothetical protein